MDCPRCGTADFYESLFSGFDCRNPECVHGTKASKVADPGECDVEAPEEEGTEMERLCAKLNISIQCTDGAHDPPADASWTPSKSWHVTLMRETSGAVDSFLETDFYGESAVQEPSESDVLGSLALDVSSVLDTEFSEWCDNLGYSDDSVRARRIYDACTSQVDEMILFLGEHLKEVLEAEH